MKRFAFLISLLLVLSIPSYSQDYTTQYSFTATTTTDSINLSGQGLNYFRLQWAHNASSAPSACTVKLQTSFDNSNWTDSITGTCTTAGVSSLTQITANFIRVNLSAYTAAATPNSLNVNVAGYVISPSSGGGSGGDVNLTQLGGTNLSGANIVDVGNTALKVSCVTGCDPGGAFTDNSAFTAGTTNESNIGGVYNDGLAAVTSGNAAAARITAQRALQTNLRNNAGTEIGTSGAPLRIDPTGSTTQPVSGTVGVSGTVTISDGAGAVNTIIDSGTLTGITNTITANAVQSGTWNTRSQDGSGNALTSGTRGSEQALSVQIVDGSGGQITTFGASDSFNAAFPSSGTAIGFSNGTNMVSGRTFDTDSGAGTQNTVGVNLRLAASGGAVEFGTSSDPIRVDPTGTTTQPVSGSVTATQATGSNLHTVLDSGTLTGITNTVTVSGTVNATVSQGTAASLNATVVQGTAASLKTEAVGSKTDNNAAPGATNVGALTSIASAAQRSAATEGNLVALSSNLRGYLRSMSCSGDATDKCADVQTIGSNNYLLTTSPPITYNSTQPSLTNGQTNDFQITARAALVVSPGVELFAVQAAPTPVTTGGLSTSYITSAASTNSTNVKASAGQVYVIHVTNTTATLYYLRMYNLSSAPTCSSATGFVETIPVPASATGAGFVRPIDLGQTYSTGIGYCLTGGGSSTDNTSAATGVYISILYK
jgi:hypothetical protein